MLLLLLFIGLCLSFLNASNDHYPQGEVPRPCVQKGYTVRYEGPICIPTGEKSFNEQSAINCKNPLLKECPEFNEAYCVWVNFTCSNHQFVFPACRLKYYATKRWFSKSTWIEVFYVNQRGTTTDGMWPIVELRRHIKETDVFPYPQEDYPKNVQDPLGIQGLKWTPVTLTPEASAILTKLDAKSVCASPSGDISDCTLILANATQAMVRNFSLAREYGGNSLEAIVTCADYIVDERSKKVCRMKYQKQYKDEEESAPFIQTVMECQGYYDGKGLVLRKAVLGGNSILPNGSTILGNTTS